MATFQSVTSSIPNISILNQFKIDTISSFDPDYTAPTYSGWTTSSGEPYQKFSSDFTINLYRNLSSQYSLRSGLSTNGSTEVTQVPFSLGAPAPISLRLRGRAYILVPEGHNPYSQAGTPPSQSIT